MLRNRRFVVLVAILVVLLGVLGYQRMRGSAWRSAAAGPAVPAAGGAPASGRAPLVPPDSSAVAGGPAAPVRAPGRQASDPAVAEVNLAKLAAPRPGPGAAARNLFRFQPKPPPPPPIPVAPPKAAGTTADDGAPPPPPPPPPIALKLAGIVEASRRGVKIAVLIDGRGNTLYGAVGDIVDGRYRILEIGVESIDLVHLDGRGRERKSLGGR